MELLENLGLGVDSSVEDWSGRSISRVSIAPHFSIILQTGSYSNLIMSWMDFVVQQLSSFWLIIDGRYGHYGHLITLVCVLSDDDGLFAVSCNTQFSCTSTWCLIFDVLFSVVDHRGNTRIVIGKEFVNAIFLETPWKNILCGIDSSPLTWHGVVRVYTNSSRWADMFYCVPMMGVMHFHGRSFGVRELFNVARSLRYYYFFIGDNCDNIIIWDPSINML